MGLFDRFLYRRFVITRVMVLLEYLMLELCYAGGSIFSFLQWFYTRTFESSQRQIRSRERIEQDTQRDKELRGGEPPDYENSLVTGRNRRPCHAPLRAFTSREAGLRFWSEDYDTRDRHASNICLLTGKAGEPDYAFAHKWKFMLVADPHSAPPVSQWTANSSTGALNGGSWKDVALPSHWQLEGVGSSSSRDTGSVDVPIYTNTTYPFPFDPPRARRTGEWKVTDCDKGLGGNGDNRGMLDEKEPGENATGLFRRTFSLPQQWTVGGGDSNRIFLVFEGVDSSLTVYVNGIFIGYSQDSCLPAEFDITDALFSKNDVGEKEQQQHTLCVQVTRWCDGSYLEDQDKWWLSGIYREIYLLHKPRCFIADYEFSADVVTKDILLGSVHQDDNEKHLEAIEKRMKKQMIEEELKKGGRDEDDISAAEIEALLLEQQSKKQTQTGASICVSVLVEGLPESHPISSSKGNGGGAAGGARGGESMDEVFVVRGELFRNGQAGAGELPVLIMAGYVERGKHFRTKEIADSSLTRVDTCAERLEPAAPGAASGVATMRGIVKNPSLWSAEDPSLYTLVLSLYTSMDEAEGGGGGGDGGGGGGGGSGALDIECFRVGLRDVRLSLPHNALAVNGKAIVVAGVNRHEFHPVHGRAVSNEFMTRDIAMMKAFNFNAVRCAHYPPHPRFLELCDEAGLYVVDEANIETHGFQMIGQAVNYLAEQDDWQCAYLTRFTRMYERDKNSTSVILWSLGNESGHGRAHETMSTWCRARDPRRLCQYESGGARTASTDIICPMYQRIEWCVRHCVPGGDPLTGGDEKLVSRSRPVILCEYAHAMGNSGGCLSKYWKKFWDKQLPRLQGGFIWDLIDQGLVMKVQGEGGKEVDGFGFGGDFGDVPNTSNFCINGLFGPDRLPHPSAYEAKACQAPVGLSMCMWEQVETSAKAAAEAKHQEVGNGDVSKLCITVENRYSHIDLSHLEIRVQLKSNAALVVGGAGGEVKSFEGGAVLPGESFALGVLECVPFLSSYSSSKDSSKKSTAAAGGGANNISLDQLVKALGITKQGLLQVTEVWLDVSVCLTAAAASGKSASWIEWMGGVGHVIAHHTFTDHVLLEAVRDLAASYIAANTIKSPPHLLIVTYKESHLNNTQILIRWPDGATATVGTACGRLLTWTDAQGQTLLSAPIAACVYRAPTDNDRGGLTIGYAGQWTAAGLHGLRQQQASIVSCESMLDGSVCICTKWSLAPPPDAAAGCVNIPCTATYIFLPLGGVSVAITVSPPASLPPLPRVGMRFAIPSEFHQASWFGLGPHEAYPDRLECVHLDVFGAVSVNNEMQTPYVHPQECGRRADPRWSALRTDGGKGRGMLFISDPCEEDNHDDEVGVHGWGFSASPFSLEALCSSLHHHALRRDEDDKVHVHIDSRSMGVGGYDSWSPNVDAEFMLENGGGGGVHSRGVSTSSIRTTRRRSLRQTSAN